MHIGQFFQEISHKQQKINYYYGITNLPKSTERKTQSLSSTILIIIISNLRRKFYKLISKKDAVSCHVNCICWGILFLTNTLFEQADILSQNRPNNVLLCSQMFNVGIHLMDSWYFQ